MAEDTEKAIEANNFHVRFTPGDARWLREQVSQDAPSVPEVIRQIVTERQIEGRIEDRLITKLQQETRAKRRKYQR